MDADVDFEIRLAAFRWLTDLRERSGDVLSRSALLTGFAFRDRQIGLMSPQQGIWKPAMSRLPLSITTTLNGPYRDAFNEQRGEIDYAYQGSNPDRWDNAGLRQAMREQKPLVYFHPVVFPGRYIASYPVFVVRDDEASLRFSVQLDAPSSITRLESEAIGEDRHIRRAYYTSTVRRRVHQASFRESVLMAYGQMCTLCRLRHTELLDAAHIVADSDPEGEPRVSNGLALCKLHHAAFDNFFLTVTPEYRVEVQKSLLLETDGPMLVVGLQAIHGQTIQLPRVVQQRPDQEQLARRLDRFWAAGLTATAGARS